MSVVEWCLRHDGEWRFWTGSGGANIAPESGTFVNLYWHLKANGRLAHIIIIGSYEALKKYASAGPEDRYILFMRDTYARCEAAVPQVQRMMGSGGWT